jgi:hypothetical protein
MVIASHDGFGTRCKRSFSLVPSGFLVEDFISGTAISRVHVAQICSLQKTEDGYIVNTPVARLVIENAIDVRLEKAKASIEYNKFYDIYVAVVSFRDYLRYIIS